MPQTRRSAIPVPVTAAGKKQIILKVRQGTPQHKIKQLLREANLSNFEVTFTESTLRRRSGSHTDLTNLGKVERLAKTDRRVVRKRESLTRRNSVSDLQKDFVERLELYNEVQNTEGQGDTKMGEENNLYQNVFSFKMNPGKFAGETGEDVDDFLSHFDRACRVNNWVTEEVKSRYLPIFLVGAAATWLDNLEATEPDLLVKYEDLKVRLRAAFEPRVPADRAEFKLRNRVQGVGESIESYYQDIMRLCRLVNKNMAKADIARHILHGLSRTIIQEVMLLNNETPEEVLANARKVEVAKSYGSADSVQTDLLKQSNAQIVKLTEQLAELTAQVRHKSGGYDSNNFRQINAIKGDNVRMDGKTGYQGNNKGNYQQLDRFGRPSRTSDGRPICFICFKANHIARNCYQRVNRDNDRAGQQPRYQQRQQNLNPQARAFKPQGNNYRGNNGRYNQGNGQQQGNGEGQ